MEEAEPGVSLPRACVETGLPGPLSERKEALRRGIPHLGHYLRDTEAMSEKSHGPNGLLTGPIPIHLSSLCLMVTSRKVFPDLSI